MSRWKADERAALEFYAGQGYTAREIAEQIPGRSRNAVIGHCNRNHITLGYDPLRARRKFLRLLDSLMADGQRCSRVNGGCRNPSRQIIYRTEGTQCGHPGCSNNRIPYALHGLCSTHNAGRLAERPRQNNTRDVTAAVGW